jgi:hypothetical protein
VAAADPPASGALVTLSRHRFSPQPSDDRG